MILYFPYKINNLQEGEMYISHFKPKDRTIGITGNIKEAKNFGTKEKALEAYREIAKDCSREIRIRDYYYNELT